MINAQSLLAEFEKRLDSMTEAELIHEADKALRDSCDSYLLDATEEHGIPVFSQAKKIEERFHSNSDYAFSSSRICLGQSIANSYNVSGEGGNAAA